MTNAARPASLRRASARIWCEASGCSATVTVIERACDGRRTRFVQWCSLRDTEQHCLEKCLQGIAGETQFPALEGFDSQTDFGAALESGHPRGWDRLEAR